mmetsp:Transcript_16164/g.39381  ORF Transcript_16164/g.39381 Transcript_16164/m.39381 type:complete len:209 (+) Transcript_16164:101-727(+)
MYKDRTQVANKKNLHNNELPLGVRRDADVLGVQLPELLDVARVEVDDALPLLREERLPDDDEHGHRLRNRRAPPAHDRERRPELDVLVDHAPELEVRGTDVREERILSEAEDGHDAAAVVHGDLGEALAVLEVEHILVVECALKHLLDAANDEPHGVAVLELALDLVLVGPDEADEVEPVADEGDPEHGVVDAAKHVPARVGHLREPL